MIDPWELLLHHSYSGKPGVIVDQSPKRRSHGRAINLDEGDFSVDGADAGTGAISFHDNGLVRVSPSEPWNKLTAVRVEIVCICDVAGGGGTLIDAPDSFTFTLRGGTPGLSYGEATGGSGVRFGPVLSAGKAVPSNTWVTVGFWFDTTAGYSFFSLNGQQIADFDNQGANPWVPARRIAIGNSFAGDSPWQGRIDDIKVWRLDPHWVDKTFVNRPMDPGATDCWKRWSDALNDAFKDDPECGRHVVNLLNAAIKRLIQKAIHSSANSRAIWEAAVAEYQQKWAAGDVTGAANAVAGVISALGIELQLTSDPAFSDMFNDPCVKKLIGRLPKLDCDQQFIDYLGISTKQVESLL